MKIKADVNLIIVFSAFLLLSGCATINTIANTNVDIDTSNLSRSNAPDASVNVLVTVTDKRNFIDGSEDAKDHSINNVPAYQHLKGQEARVIGRKTTNYGYVGRARPVGHLLLPENQTVSGLVKAAIESVLRENGWKVLDNESERTPKTNIIDVSVSRFWMWPDPHFVYWTMYADITADVMNTSLFKNPITITGQHNENFYTDTTLYLGYDNVLQAVYKAFKADAKAKLGTPSKPVQTIKKTRRKAR